MVGHPASRNLMMKKAGSADAPHGGKATTANTSSYRSSSTLLKLSQTNGTRVLPSQQVSVLASRERREPRLKKQRTTPRLELSTRSAAATLPERKEADAK